MKLQKIKEVCGRLKCAYIFNKTDEDGELKAQYISDGKAIYEIGDSITLTESILSAVWDISEKDSGKWRICSGELPSGINCEWGLSETFEPQEMGIKVIYGNCTYIPFDTGAGMVFINTKYLSPIIDEIESLTFFERKTVEGTPYIVAMRGFVFVAAFLPEMGDIAHEIGEECRRIAARVKT